MSSFDDREKAQENKHAHDQEFNFKVVARRNKLLGLWAAQKMGKKGNDVDNYAKSVVISDFAEPGDDDVLRKVLHDFKSANVPMTREILRAEMDKLLIDARKEMLAQQ